MKKHSNLLMLLMLLLSIAILFVGNVCLLNDGDRNELLKTNSSGFTHTNATVISDGFGGIYWNDGISEHPSIVTDNQGGIHIAWHDSTDGIWGIDDEILYLKYTAGVGWSNVTAISDGYGGIYWNDEGSYRPSLAVDSEGGVHVAWYDRTLGPWGGGSGDSEIMYAKYTPGIGWSNATVISDGYGGIYWNTGNTYHPCLDVDSEGGVHVAWHDETNGPWGVDTEIWYVKYTPGLGWSNASLVSDGYGTGDWNGGSTEPSISVDDQGGVHIVWRDVTDGLWRAGPSDSDIFYSVNIDNTGWLFPKVISDGYEGYYWNDLNSYQASIATDSQGKIHVVWQDYTPGYWGTDTEILYACSTPGSGWSNVTVISDLYWTSGADFRPRITVDNQDRLHVAWYGQSDDPSPGSDYEILYALYTKSTGWSYPLDVSDGYNGSYWNDGDSSEPSITVDTQGVAHIAWSDDTESMWGSDYEILYASVDVPFAEPSAPSTPLPSGFTLNSTAEDPDDDGTFYLFWSESEHAEEYSVYYEKMEVNSTITQIGSGLTDRTFPVMGLSNGDYTFHVEAQNAVGTTSSNELNITVTIASESTSSDDDDDSDSDEQNGEPSISFGSYFLAYLVVGLITVGSATYYKYFIKKI